MATPLFNAQELAVAGLEENKNRYQDLKNRAEKSASTYDWNLFDPKTYGNFGNWLANGVSGGGWTHKGRMEKAGFTDDVDNYGKEGLLSSYDLGNLEGQYTGSMRNRTNQLEAGKGLFSGVPVIGGLLSAPAQAVSAGKDFAESGTSKWDSGKRDAVSDIGAIGETALDLATLGTGMGAKTALGTIGKGAALGAGYGLAGGLNEMGKDTDLGTLALQTGLGGAIGGGIAGLGYGAGKLWNKYAKGSPSKELAIYNGGSAQGGAYQDALNTLKGAGLDTTNPETLNKSFKKWVIQNHPDKGGSTELFQSVSGAKKLYQDALNGKASATASQVANAGPVRQSLGQQFRNFAGNIPNMGRDVANSKMGTRVSNLLKTKAGKVGAGVGGGLLLAKLLAGQRGQPAQDSLSDEELMQLYNYYGGGQ